MNKSMTMVGAVCLVALVLFLTIGPGGQTPKEIGVSADTSFEQEALPISEKSIELLENGVEPRVRLRLKLKVGSVQSLMMRMKMAMSMNMGGQQVAKMEMPWINMPIEFDIEEVSPSGSARVSMSFKEASLEPDGVNSAMVASMQQGLAFLTGGKCKYKLSERGESTDVSCSFPGNVPPQFAQMLEQMNQGLVGNYVFLPQEPVGVGAKWKVITKNFVVGNVKGSMERTYHLTDKEGDLLTLSMKFTQTMPEQTLKLPGHLPKNFKARILSAEGGGNGEVTMDLTKLMFRAKMKSTLKQQILMSQGENMPQQKMNQEIEVKMEFVDG